MSVEPGSVRKTPWLIIILGVLAVLCLCAILCVIAIVAYITPLSGSTISSEPTPIVIFETPLPAEVPTQETANAAVLDAVPAGTAVEIGNDMTLTILDVTRPTDDLVTGGSSLNTTAPEGEEFIQVDVEVTCSSDPGTQCTFYPTVMKAVLSDGSRRDLQTFIEGVEDWDTAVEIEGGATEQGFLLFIVPKSESTIVVSYNGTSSDQPVYLQLP